MEKEYSSGYILGLIFVGVSAIVGLVLLISYFALFVFGSMKIAEIMQFAGSYTSLFYYLVPMGVIGVILSLMRLDLKNGMLVYLCDCFTMLVAGSGIALGYNLNSFYDWKTIIALIVCFIFTVLLFVLRCEIREKR